jgi:hypothetical protein
MIDLPSYPQPASATASELDFGVLLSPPTGGEDQRLNRLGNRHRFQVTMPPMPSAKLGRQWLVALKRAKKEGGRIMFPLLDFDPGYPGNVLVNGGTATGSTLPVKGASPAYVFRAGQPFSIETLGRHYLYFNAVEVIADSSGNATLTIDPPLRTQPANNDVCHFDEPMIEGFIEGDELAWQMSVARVLGFDFTIREAR